jgi:hypothetical protein
MDGVGGARGADGGFASMRAAFAAAASIGPDPAVTRQVWLAGRPVELASAGARLTEVLASAFAHLLESRPCRQAEAIIEAWDLAVSPVLPPPFAGTPEWSLVRPGVALAIHGNSRFMREQRPGSVIWLDRGGARLAAAFGNAADFLLYERARPFSRFIAEFCTSLGAEAIHAAMIGVDGRGVLIAGGSGRGKTTSAVDCLANGLDFLGDDTVAISPGGAGGFTGYSLYASARVHPVQLSRWPGLLSHWVPPGPDDDKAMLLPIETCGIQMPRFLPIAAIVIPRVAPGPVTLRPASGAAAFHALVLQSPENRRLALRRDQFDLIARLTRTVPTYVMDVGPDSRDVAAAFARIVRELQ